MGRNSRDNSRWVGSLLAAVTAGTAFCVPAVAQHTSGATGHNSTGHTGHNSTGHVVAARPMGPRGGVGTPTRGGQRTGSVHANTLGAGSLPTPSWELPKSVTPHWEIPSYIHIQPNAVQGNPIPRQRGGFAVGYAGIPYYVNPMAFVNADAQDDQENDPAQQAQPSAPSRPDYAQQGRYAEGPESTSPESPSSESPNSDQGYPAPPRAPYNPEAYPPPAQNSPAAQSAAPPDNGLDHPAVTLVFNDGRPPMQVHSYVLTGSSVFVAEKGHQRVIPVTDLDLPATVAQNREAGVDFELPGGRK